MSQVTVVQVVYNNRRFLEPVFKAIANQSFRDFHAVAVIAGNRDSGKEYLQQNFPWVEIIDPGCNVGFARGHNLVFEKFASDFFQLVNPDLVLEADYLEKILKAFGDARVGAATGKLYQFEKLGKRPEDFRGCRLLDSTGVTISKSGRARDRGQHELDSGQYDQSQNVPAVSAAGAMYRREALMATRVPKRSGGFEYFDESFHSYWEDVDLAWRMSNAGWKSLFVPGAVGYHGRTAGSSPKGYRDIAGFVRHHRRLSPFVRKLNYQNHILMYLKNARRFHWSFFIREFFMLGYILLFEISTLSVLPQLIRLLPEAWAKRRYIKSMRNA